MSSGGSDYTYEIEELVKKYKKEFRESGYQIISHDVDVKDFEAWLCEELEKSRKEAEEYHYRNRYLPSENPWDD